MPLEPSGITSADTALDSSVISVTTDSPPLTEVTLPARPPAAITGSSICTPSPLPALMTTFEYQTVGEREITRAVMSLSPAAKLLERGSPTSERSSEASR